MDRRTLGREEAEVGEGRWVQVHRSVLQEMWWVRGESEKSVGCGDVGVGDDWPVRWGD